MTTRPRLRAAVLVLAVLLLLPAAAHAQADRTGEWKLMSGVAPINPIHIALLRTGKVLVVAGSENDPTKTTYRAALFDPRTGAWTVQSIDWDLFCNAMSQLPDGRIFITGGNLQYNPFKGIKTTTIFDPATEDFIQVHDMARGRWYPSNATLSDGQTMTFGGWLDTAGTNNAVELYRVAGGWTPEFPAPFVPPLYPWLHLLPDGRVFMSGSTTATQVFNPATKAWTALGRTVFGKTREYGSSVLLPLRHQENYRARVMVMGGAHPGETATATAEMIDFGVGSPAWQSLPSMSAARIQMNAVLLPTGKVLALGGSVRNNDASTASLNADLFDPATRTWSPAGTMKLPRMYHSIALLLPDATVWVAGSNPFQGAWENRMETYAPAYLFTRDAAGNLVSAPRPTITTAPARVGYDDPFRIDTPSAANIGSVVLVRNGSPTHAFDFDQRLVELPFTAGSGFVTATAPPDGKIAPPGYYMLFLVDKKGVPSVAKFVQLTATPTNRPPRGVIANPTGDVRIKAGQSVTFAGDATDPDGDGTVNTFSWVFPSGTPATSTAPVPGQVTFSTPGSYVVSLTVKDSQGENDPSPPSRIITVDPSAFTARFTSPPAGASVYGVQAVGMEAAGAGRAPFRYVLRIDGVQKVDQTTSATSLTYSWNTKEVADGVRTLSLSITDADGTTATASRQVTVENDRTSAIKVDISSPAAGATVKGVTWVTIWVSGATGPYNFRMSVGNTTVWTESSANTRVSLPWDTTKTPDGPQTLVVTVSTATKTGSRSLDVIVQNGPPTTTMSAAFTAPPEGSTVSGTVNVTAGASNGTAPYTFTLKLDNQVVLSQSGPSATISYPWNTTGTTDGAHRFDLTVTDSASRTATATRNLTVNNGGGGGGGGGGTLSVAMTSPANGATVKDTVWAVVWLNTAGTAPYRYELSVAGQVVWAETFSTTRGSLPWDTKKTPDGPQTVTAKVTDSTGKFGTTSVNVTVANGTGGTTPPPLTAGFSSPANGATVASPVAIGMTASGGSPAYTYALDINGSRAFTQTTTSGTTSFTWSPTTNGTYTLALTVTDSASRTATASRTVTVDNGGGGGGGGGGGTLTIATTSPANNSTVKGTVWAMTWVNSVGTAPYRYQLAVDGQVVWTETSSNTRASLPWDTTKSADGPHTMTITVTDSAARAGSTTLNVTAANGAGGGSTAPLAAGFSSPANGSTVTSPVTVGMTATGGTPPYTYALDINGSRAFTQSTSATTTSYAWSPADGSYTLRLTVTDAASATATTSRSVTVSSGGGGGGGSLSVAMTSPASGSTVKGTAWASIWLTSAGTAPFSYTLTAAGATVWSEISSATHVTLPWDTTKTPNGPQTLTITVRDAENRTGTSSVSVTVQNP